MHDRWSSPEDGAEEAAGLVGPEVAGVGFHGGGLVGVLGLVVEAVGAEEDGLVRLRLAERERQECPRRVPLRLAQRRRRSHRRSTAWPGRPRPDRRRVSRERWEDVLRGAGGRRGCVSD